ncbi:MAG: hypothetical protein LBR93_09020 [Treponema sp.]|jgi:hypothetical protein|nr:hypothetical protein [Treponema sp.]
MKKLKKPFFTFLLPCILSSLFSPAAFSQDFSSIDSAENDVGLPASHSATR